MTEKAPSWDDLTPQQRQGMTRQYWETLPAQNQLAYVSDVCWHAGCDEPRAYGSPFCVAHVPGEQP